MTQTENLVKRIPNDIGGLPAERIGHVDYQLEPWEKRCHALADVLDFHKIINTEEKRCGVEALGADSIIDDKTIMYTANTSSAGCQT